MIRSIATAGVLLGLTATAVQAQEERYTADGFGPDAGSWELILSGSGTNDNDFDAGSGSVNAELGYYLTEPLSIGIRQQLGLADGDDVDFTWNAATNVFVDYHFDFGAFRPFIGASLGYIYGDEDIVEDSFIAGPEAGVKWYVKDETFIYGRVSYDFIFEDSDDADDALEDGRFNYVLGIGFNF